MLLCTYFTPHLHALYVQAADKQLEGFKMMKDGVAKKDKQVMNNAFKLLSDGRNLEKQWAMKYEDIAKSH